MKKLFTKFKLLIRRYWWLAVIWYGFKLSLLLFTIFFFTSCEKDFHPDVNYVYTFSALVHKDEWGIETWGAHQFIVDNKIENPTKFKECYVNYLKWSGLDEDGMYKKIYYADPKHVKVEFLKESRLMWTVSAHDGCQ